MSSAPPVVHIVGFGGSLKPPSKSLGALKVALRGAEGDRATTELFDLSALEIPLYVPGGEPAPDATRLADAFHAADGLIWSSPMYHGTITGAFKNALDHLQILSRAEPAYLTDKVIGLISTAGGAQGLQAVNTMEFVVRALRGFAVPMVVPVAKAHEPIPETTEQQLLALGAEVARVAWRFREGGRLEQECEAARTRLASVGN